MALLGLTTVLYCFLYGDFKLRREVALIPLFAIVAFIGTMLYSKEYRDWFSLILLSISFIIFIYAFKVINNKFIILNIITISFFFFSLYFIYYFRRSFIHLNLSTRLGPPFDNQNGVAAFAVVGFSVPLYLVLNYQKKIRFVYILPALSSLLVGFATGSRTFLIIAFVFIVIFLYFKFLKHKFIYLGVVAVVIAIGLVLINLPFMYAIRDRFIAALKTLVGIAEKTDTATLERVVYIDYGFYLGGKNLIFGYGVGGFSIFSGVGTYAHSNFSELICDFGIFGFIIFYLPLLLLFLRVITNKKIEKCFVVSFFIYYIIVSLSNVFYYKKVYYLILSFLYYLVYFDTPIQKPNKLVKTVNNIVFTCDSMGSGGAEKVIASLSNEFAERDITVTIIGVSDIEPAASFYELSDVKYISLGEDVGKRIHSFKRVKMLKDLIKDLSPDVVVSFLPHVSVYTFFALLGTNITHIVSERNNPSVDPKGKVLRCLKKIAFSYSDGCVFQTKESMAFYSKRTQRKSVIIPNPIVLEYVPPEEKVIRNNVVLAVGRLEKQKNYYCLIDAFTAFNNDKKNSYILRIYGEGTLKDDLIKYCDQKKVSDYVQFMGNNTNWHKEEYKDAMYILSSDYEGMPNSLAEAIALGIPSISTDSPSGGSRELIKDGYNGYLVPVGDSTLMSQRMIDITIRNPFSGFNHKEFAESFSQSKIADLWLDYIGKIKNASYE